MYLITGAAGFIGFHTCEKLLRKNKKVYGIDNIDNYYDPKLKIKRLKILKKYKNFNFFKLDICNKDKVNSIFKNNKFKFIIHLAAQSNVRHSIKFPEKYIDTNINGFFNILNCAKNYKIKHFIYASTSSVYGADIRFPSKEEFGANHPKQMYAATKRSNELMAHTYSSLFDLPTTGLRFFTVYGPWGRPDMALFKFTRNILNNRKIDLFNNGNQTRDLIYIDDVVNCIILAVSKIPKINKKLSLKGLNPKSSYCPYRLINIGSGSPIKLAYFIELIEKYLGKKSKKKKLSFQKSDIVKTQSNNKWFFEILGYKPKIKPREGIKYFLNWYKEYYK